MNQSDSSNSLNRSLQSFSQKILDVKKINSYAEHFKKEPSTAISILNTAINEDEFEEETKLDMTLTFKRKLGESFSNAAEPSLDFLHLEAADFPDVCT